VQKRQEICFESAFKANLTHAKPFVKQLVVDVQYWLIQILMICSIDKVQAQDYGA